MRQNTGHGNDGGVAVRFADDAKYLAHRAAVGLRLGPARQVLGDRVEQGHAALRVGCDDGITNRIECDGELLGAVLQRRIGGLQQGVGGKLLIQQVLG